MVPGGRLTIEVTVIIEKDGDGFHAFCPNLKGLHVGGGTLEKTLELAQEAVVLYLNSLARHGDPLPVGPFLNVVDEGEPKSFQIPMGAFLRHVQVQWPSPTGSGTR